LEAICNLLFRFLGFFGFHCGPSGPRRTRADVEGALTLYAEQRRAAVVLVAASRGEGLDELDKALTDHRAWLTEGKRLALKRRAQEKLWVEQAIRARFGTAGLRAMDIKNQRSGGPFTRERDIARDLLARLGL